MRIAILDYGLGNLRSVEKAFAHLQADAALTEDPAAARSAAALVLPGVGAFGDGMAGLKKRGLIEPLQEAVKAGKPVLGICLGLQLFFERSSESPDVPGLGLLPGSVEKFSGADYASPGTPDAAPGQTAAALLKVPHMGWNTLSFPAPHPLFAGLEEGVHVYFVHSFFVQPRMPGDVLAHSVYGRRFCAAAGRGKLYGCQFHPEKSQQAGLCILKNFAQMVK